MNKEDVKLTSGGVKVLKELLNKPHQCQACGVFGLHVCLHVSPWRSLETDPPEPRSGVRKGPDLT